MLLGALLGAGVPVGGSIEAVDKAAPGQVGLEISEVRRGGFAATHCQVELADTAEHRTWRDVEELLNGAGLHEDVRSLAHDVFSRLAEAEGRVHGHAPEDVHFHEVGALDAIADVVGTCAGFVHLGVDRVVVSDVSVGGGTVSSEHGRLPVPPPAVVELLRGVPSSGGPVDVELCTPTGAALLTTLADGWGPQPPMVVDAVGVGAGGRDPEGHANVLRLLVGEAAARNSREAAVAVLLETNVDDLDPRLWPEVLAALLEAGASDAWLTPILMKKGRPAHTLSVLVDDRPGRRRTPGGVSPDLDHRPARAADRQARARPVDGYGRARRTHDRGQAGPARRRGGQRAAGVRRRRGGGAATASGEAVLADAVAAARMGWVAWIWLSWHLFVAIFVVELPDKTFVATLVLSTRYRPLAVWVGVGLAFLVQTLVAVLAGTSRLPARLVISRCALMFLIGGILLLRGTRADEEEADRGGVRRQGGRLPHRPAGGRRVVPRAVRRRVGRPLAALISAWSPSTATRSRSSSAPGPPCCPSPGWRCSSAGCCCAT